jgi:hypothetical protein
MTYPHPFARPRGIHWRALVTAVLLSAGQVHAAQFCVSDHNQLKAAITTATANAESDEIRIRETDIYTPFQSVAAFLAIVNDSHDIDISGGWGVGCSGQTPDPDLTRIVAGLNQSIQLLRLDLGVAAQGTISLSNLSLVGGKAAERGGCLYAMSNTSSLATLRVERVVFLRCEALHGGAAEIDMAQGKVWFRNNLVKYSKTHNGSGAVLIGGGNGDAYVHNNTFTHNSVSAGHTFDLRVYGDNLFFVYNNIFDSALPDPNAVNLRVTSATSLVRNIYLGLSGTPWSGSSGNLVGVNPGFDPSSSDPILLPSSPARNTGTNVLLGGLSALDLAGRPRLMEGTVDRGAYEFEGLFADSFE